MLIQVVSVLAVLIAVFLAYVALKGAAYEISRELAIGAPASKIFPHLNGSKAFNEWSPFNETADPKVRMTFSGPENGVGAKTNWQSEGRLGTGSSTIIESVADRSVRYKLEYVKPFEMNQDAEISIRPEGGGSVVTWRVWGRNNFVGRLMCSFMNMDKMVGESFLKGLNNLKTLSEK